MHNENLLAQPIPSSIKRPLKHLSSIHDQEMEDMEVWLLIPVEWIGWIGHGFWLLALPLVISWGTLENLPYLGVKNATQVISGMVIGFTTCSSNCYPLSPRAHTHVSGMQSRDISESYQGCFLFLPRIESHFQVRWSARWECLPVKPMWRHVAFPSTV